VHGFLRISDFLPFGREYKTLNAVMHTLGILKNETAEILKRKRKKALVHCERMQSGTSIQTLVAF